MLNSQMHREDTELCNVTALTKSCGRPAQAAGGAETALGDKGHDVCVSGGRECCSPRPVRSRRRACHQLCNVRFGWGADHSAASRCTAVRQCHVNAQQSTQGDAASAGFLHHCRLCPHAALSLCRSPLHSSTHGIEQLVQARVEPAHADTLLVLALWPHALFCVRHVRHCCPLCVKRRWHTDRRVVDASLWWPSIVRAPRFGRCLGRLGTSAAAVVVGDVVFGV